MQIKDRLVRLNGVDNNTRNIVSFYKYQNPSTKRLFIVLTLVAAVDKGTGVDNKKASVLYDSEEDRTSDFKLLMSCFDF